MVYRIVYSSDNSLSQLLRACIIRSITSAIAIPYISRLEEINKMLYKKGLTMIELLLDILILGAIAAIGIPRICSAMKFLDNELAVIWESF